MYLKKKIMDMSNIGTGSTPSVSTPPNAPKRAKGGVNLEAPKDHHKDQDCQINKVSEAIYGTKKEEVV